RMLIAVSGPSIGEGLLAYAAILRGMFPGIEAGCLQVIEEGPCEAVQQVLERSLPDVKCQVVAGDPLDEMLEIAVAQRYDLILIRQDRRDRRRSLARRLAMKAPCSVWMIPEKPPATIRNILAPIDFSRRSADTLEVASGVAAAAGADTCLAPYVYFNQATVT